MSKKETVQKMVAKMANGRRSRYDLSMILSWIREENKHELITIEFGHSHSHPRVRDKGLFISRLESASAFARVFLRNARGRNSSFDQSKRKPGDLTSDFESAVWHSYKGAPQHSFKKDLGLSKRTVERLLKSALAKVSHVDGKIFFAQMLEPDEIEVIEYFQMHQRGNLITDSRSAFDEFLKCIFEAGLAEKTEEAKLRQSYEFYTLYTICLLHNTPLLFTNGRSGKFDLHVDEDRTLKVYYTESVGDITAEYGLEGGYVAFPIYKSDLLADDYVSDALVEAYNARLEKDEHFDDPIELVNENKIDVMV